MAVRIVTPIQKRFSDVDSFLHVNNVAQQMYFDVGKVEYYDRVLGAEVLEGRLRIVTAATSTSYVSQARFSDALHVTTVCEKVGGKSIVLLQRLWAGERLCSESRSVMVAFDFVRQEKFPVPDTWRRAMLGED